MALKPIMPKTVVTAFMKMKLLVYHVDPILGVATNITLINLLVNGDACLGLKLMKKLMLV